MEKYNFKDNSDLKIIRLKISLMTQTSRPAPPPTAPGLIPALPQDEAEVEAYEDIYPYITKAQKTQKP